ncbi:MAG: hypothetical protein JNL11_20050 [Bdellovibrionaceae bacterium]|nr:hypothetical protein [Pseudobdellovibrionaceae bacterium]
MKKILIFLFLMVMISVSSAQTLYDGPMAVLLMKQDLDVFSTSRPDTVQINSLKSESGFDLYKVVLHYPAAGTINLLLKGPQGFFNSSSLSFPSLLIVSGFFTGEQSVHLVGDFKDKIVVGFEYPYSVQNFMDEPVNVLQFMRKTPAQVALTLKWLSQQSWVRSDRLSVMGVSLGGVFLPSSLHLSQSIGVRLEKAVYVCTGVDLRLILIENLKSYVAEPFLSPLVDSLLIPTQLINPQLHLPYLKGSSLVIQTAQDTVIPLTSRQGLFNLLPNPKREVVIPGPHINPDQTEVIKKVQEVVIDDFKN